MEYEVVSLEELNEELAYEFDNYDEDYEFEALDELSVTLAVAELLEELSDSLA